MVPMQRILLFLLMYLSLSNLSLWSQGNQENFNFTNIKEVTSKAGISTIVQDNYGFLWIGTNGSGVYRYDGSNYTSYKHLSNDSTSIASNLIFCSYFDSKNRLWIGTDEGLNLYDPNIDRFTKITLEKDAENLHPNKAISSLEEDQEGNLFIGVFGQGIFKLDTDSLKVEKISLLLANNTSEVTARSICADKWGNVYAGTNLGLLEYDSKKNVFKPTLIRGPKGYNPFADFIQYMILDGEDNIWAGTYAEGLYKLSRRDKIDHQFTKKEHFPISNNPFLTMIPLPDSTILCGTENDGLFHMDREGNIINHLIYNKNKVTGILSNSIWSLFQDKEQRVWLGYYNKGLAVSDPLFDKFKEIESIFNVFNSLQESSVTSIVQDSKNRFWMGMDGGGIDILDMGSGNGGYIHINSKNQGPYSGLTSDYIQTVFIDSNQNVWVGSWDKGVYFLKNGSYRFINYTEQNTQGGLGSNTITSIAEDKNGVIWIGSFNNGLQSYDPLNSKFTHHVTDSFIKFKLDQSYIWKVLVDSKNNLWLGTTKGLFKITQDGKNKFEIVSMADKLSHEYNNPLTANNILSLFESSDHSIWVGTKGAGLCKYDPSQDSFTWYNKSNGLEEESVSAINEDLDGNIWITGNSGLTKLILKTNKFTHFTKNDGLISNDYNLNATFRDGNGNIYVGGYMGVDYFDPDKIRFNTNETTLYLTNFRLFNKIVWPTHGNSPLHKVISETDSISLNSKQSVFTIEYSGINFTRPEKNEYAYFLEGYETTWNYVGNSKSATYTNLDPGYYTFKLKASNNDGVWNKTPLSLSIHVLPPWWKTSWAILAYIIVLLVGLYLLNRMTQIRLKERQQMQYEREMRKQEKRLDEKKFQFFTNISHEFRTPLTLILNPIKDIINDETLPLPTRIREKHHVIFKNTDRLYRLVTELLDFSKLESNKVTVLAKRIDLVPFTKDIIQFFREEAATKNIDLQMETEMDEVILWADEGMLEKIVFNILSNAFKVTPEGGMIMVQLLAQENKVILPLIDQAKPVEVVVINISDTGTGLEKGSKERIFERFYQVDSLNKGYYGGTGIGLEVVNEFVKLHKGKIEVESQMGYGTTFKILFPAGKHHFSKEELKTEGVRSNFQEETILPQIPSSDYPNEDPSPEISPTATLLIVEDNVELRTYLKKELNDQYKIVTAKEGVEGLAMAKEFMPDIIMTDILMPRMNGFEFCRSIKSDIRTSHIPLMMLTAKGRIDDRIEGLEMGADAYMVKPFDMRLLKLRLAQLVTSRRLIFNKYFSAISNIDENNNTSALDKNFIEKVLLHINKNIGNPDLNVESLASNLNLSRSQFYRKIKALTNLTANEFIRNIRLQRAKQLIESGNTNITDVCFKVGFSSPSYFTKCFKNYFGILPTNIEGQKL